MSNAEKNQHQGTQSVIKKVVPLLTPPWPTLDPFLFCVHHDDQYPAGDTHMAPKASLKGRHIGSDFSGLNGWSMYHGDRIPGFPRHPHRGFETITLARQGYIDHSDSMGATARFGKGDVQWMTAGKGVVHSEMFPLVNESSENPTELFQIWINLPKKDKFKSPYFTMFWSENVPKINLTDKDGRNLELTVIAGQLHLSENQTLTPPSPPPSSWAARAEADVAIWTLKMEPGAEWTVPAGQSSAVNRAFYFFKGQQLMFNDQPLEVGHLVQVDPVVPLRLINGSEPAELLMLQGRPIGEPVVQYGPFVMNTREEIRQAMIDYQRTQFGGWPWPEDGPAHARTSSRFARHADGRIEKRS